MKRKEFILPIIALAIAVVWLGRQHLSLSKLKTEIDLMSRSIIRHTPAANGEASQTDQALSKMAKTKSVNWKAIAPSYGREMFRTIPNVRELASFQERRSKMSKEELVTMLEELTTLHLSPSSQKELEDALLSLLIGKDPALAVTTLSGRLEEENMPWGNLNNAFSAWAVKDLTKAAAWLDQQIAAGKVDSKLLDGSGAPRIELEARLFQVLLASDLNTAVRRLSAVPEHQRVELLAMCRIKELKKEDQLAYADIVRSQLPANQQGRILSKLFSAGDTGEGYLGISKMFDHFQASPSERAGCAEDLVMNQLQHQGSATITRGQLDTMREWITSQAPEAMARITGKSLASISSDQSLVAPPEALFCTMSYSEAAALALEYSQAGGGDEVLGAFLKGLSARQNLNQARVLAGNISDLNLREQILNTLK